MIRRRKTLKFALIVVLVVAIGSFFGYRQFMGAAQGLSDQDGPRAVRKKENATVYFDSYGFDPNILTVPFGTTVTVKNISSIKLNFESMPDQLEQNSALNLGNISPGTSKEFSVNRSGGWQFEANGDPEIRGFIKSGHSLSIKPWMLPNAKSDSAQPIMLEYDDYGFMPNELSVPVGSSVSLTNKSTQTQPGPSTFKQGKGMGGAMPALNIGLLNKQQTKRFTINQTGSWLLHNIDQPKEKAYALITSYTPKVASKAPHQTKSSCDNQLINKCILINTRIICCNNKLPALINTCLK